MGQALPLTFLGCDHRELPAGFVDHLVAEHHRARPFDLCRRRENLEDVQSAVEVALVFGVDLVGRVNLCGVENPLAVESDGSRSFRGLAKAIEIRNLAVWAVDQIGRASCRERV